jgi:hypothetical protein
MERMSSASPIEETDPRALREKRLGVLKIPFP